MSETPQLSAELDFAIRIAQEAGDVLLSHFGGPLTKEIKTHDEDFATEADHKSEELIIAAIQDRFPEDSILAEESGRFEKSGAYTWIVDPLDGTFNFADGNSNFGVLIARADEGEIDLGVAYNPHSGELGVAQRGKGCWYNGESIRFTTEIDGPPRPLLGAWPDAADADVLERLEEHWVAAGVQPETLRSACANGLAVLRGDYDLYVGSSFQPWDYSPMVIIFKEAGLAVSNLRGEELDWRNGSQSIIGAPVGEHRAIMDIISES